MANEPDSARHRAQLMEMAEAWRALAEEAERFEQLVLEMDQAFETPRARKSPLHASQRPSH